MTTRRLHPAGLHRARSSTATATSAAARRPSPRRARTVPRTRGPNGAPAAAPAPSRRPRPGSATHPRPSPGRPTGWPPPRSGPPGRAAAAARSPAGSARRSTRLRGARLGAGLTTIPAVPAIDAAKAILDEPEVPEDKRFCPSCGAPVGRVRDGQPGRTEGFCAKCRNPFSFTPSCRPATSSAASTRWPAPRPRRPRLDLPRPRQERVRPLGRAQGPAQLRRPRRAGRRDRRAAVPRPGRAPADRRDLQLRHPRRRRLHRHGVRRRHLAEGAAQGADAGGGRPLRPAAGRPGHRLHHRDPAGVPVPARPRAWSTATSSRTTSSRSATRSSSSTSAACAASTTWTPRSTARSATRRPRCPGSAPSVASDIYTIGRTLVVLSMEFRGYQSTYVASLPPVAETPLFQQHDSLYRLLAKACAPDPADRFVSRRRAARAAARGAARGGRGRRRADGAAAALDVLPAVRRRRAVTDDAAGLARPAHAAGRRQRPAGRLAAHRQRRRPGAAAGRAPQAPDVRRRGAAGHRPRRARGRPHRHRRPRRCARCSPPTRGSGAPCGCPGWPRSARDDAAGAQAAFNAVYGQVPGELAPKLALALACETGGERDVAESLYVTCARTDANYIAPAAFGLARIRGRARRRRRARVARARPGAADQPRLHLGPAPRGPGCSPSRAAGCPPSPRRWGSIDEPHPRPDGPGHALRATCCSAALGQVLSRTAPSRTVSIAGRPAAEPALRDGLEAAYRELAGHAPEPVTSACVWSTRPTPCADGRLR